MRTAQDSAQYAVRIDTQVTSTNYPGLKGGDASAEFDEIYMVDPDEKAKQILCVGRAGKYVPAVAQASVPEFNADR